MPRNKRTDNRNNRADHQPGHRGEYERNRRKILATQSVCAICGLPVDKALRFPNPMAATVDHIVPLERGGHPSALENLQLAHAACNRAKGTKLHPDNPAAKGNNTSAMAAPNTVNGLPWTLNWYEYKADPETGDSNSADLIDQADNLHRRGYVITIKGIQPR